MNASITKTLRSLSLLQRAPKTMRIRDTISPSLLVRCGAFWLLTPSTLWAQAETTPEVADESESEQVETDAGAEETPVPSTAQESEQSTKEVGRKSLPANPSPHRHHRLLTPTPRPKSA